MTLDRALALFFLAFCLAYGYSAYFLMDDLLPPFAKFSPVWPSTFPKVISAIGIVLALAQVILWSGKPANSELDFTQAKQYEWKAAIGIIVLMVGYALLLRYLGFVTCTILFIVLASTALGERKLFILIIAASIATIGIWYLVDQVLGIFLRPWPAFIYGGN